MKQTLLIVLFLSVGFSQQEYNDNDIIEMDNGLFTVKFSDEPITGKVYGYFGEVKPYKKVYMGNLLNGKKEGRWKLYYHSTGKKRFDFNYKDGEFDGLSTGWYENGQKKYEITHKNGKQDGLLTSWFENGQKEIEVTHKNGKRDGIVTSWFENGQKESEGTHKNGKQDGLWTVWYENGQKEMVGTYKMGKTMDYGLGGIRMDRRR